MGAAAPVPAQAQGPQLRRARDRVGHERRAASCGWVSSRATHEVRHGVPDPHPTIVVGGAPGRVALACLAKETALVFPLLVWQRKRDRAASDGSHCPRSRSASPRRRGSLSARGPLMHVWAISVQRTLATDPVRRSCASSSRGSTARHLEPHRGPQTDDSALATRSVAYHDRAMATRCAARHRVALDSWRPIDHEAIPALLHRATTRAPRIQVRWMLRTSACAVDDAPPPRSVALAH
jgi:hypothetical protein